MALYIGDTLIAASIDGQQLNNPFSLLDYKYSEYELSNASWLLSNGQFNSGATYSAVYNLLLQIYNGTVTKAGVSVKLSTETYADTDFVLNTDDTTFRLPAVVKLASGKAVAGNGGEMNFYTTANETDLIKLVNREIGGANQYLGRNSGNNWGSSQNTAVKLTSDPTKSGIETSANGLYLYFYVGETIQDANIITAAGVLTRIAELSDSYISGLGMPSSTYDSLTLGASGAWYTAPANGWFAIAKGGNNGEWVYVGDTTSQAAVFVVGTSAGYAQGLFPVKKGKQVQICYTANGGVAFFNFIYAEGEN